MGLQRLSPADGLAAIRDGAALIDIRSDDQRRRDGPIPGAIAIPRNVLEWRCDPASPDRDVRTARRDRRLLLICDEGYQSSLAAATLRRFGLDVTDIIGGFQGWRASGMPVESPVSASD
jgi:rhodanese-related sulfurtransferase